MGRALLAGLALQLALTSPADARWRPRVPQVVKRLGDRLGDRLVGLRGQSKALNRVERLYEQGRDRRSLSILRRMLNRKKLDPTARTRALLYVGTIQTRLGNHDQAMRAFAGLAHHRPDFDLPQNIDAQIHANFAQGRYLAFSGGTRSESVSAQLPPEQRRPSLLNRLRDAKRRIGDKVWATVVSRPRLTAVAAHTIGRFNVWRAQNTLDKHGVVRFKVNLEPDAKQFGGGYTRPDGTVAVDHSLTLRYPMALGLLAHEGYHVMAPNELGRQSTTYIGLFSDTQAKIAQLRRHGRTIPKTTAAGRAQRGKIAADLKYHRNMLRRTSDALWKERLKEEGRAEHFAGQVLGRENQPVTYAIWRRATSDVSPVHPKPQDMARYFMDGVSQSVQEMTGMKIPKQMNRQREQVNRMLERLQQQAGR